MNVQPSTMDCHMLPSVAHVQMSVTNCASFGAVRSNIARPIRKKRPRVNDGIADGAPRRRVSDHV